MKTFSLDEAQSLLPILESLLRRAIDAKASAGLVEADLQMLSQNIFLSGGMLVDVAAVARKRMAQRAAVQQAQDAIQEIDSIGVQVKDLDKGLLDFPCQVGEQIVLLCWQTGRSKNRLLAYRRSRIPGQTAAGRTFPQEPAGTTELRPLSGALISRRFLRDAGKKLNQKQNPSVTSRFSHISQTRDMGHPQFARNSLCSQLSY